MSGVFRLIKPTIVITFNIQGRGSLSVLPVDAQIRIAGHSSVPGFIDVAYGGIPCRMFLVDLIARSVELRIMVAAS